MKLADIATNILDDQNENIEKTNDHDDDRSSENEVGQTWGFWDSGYHIGLTII